MSEPNDKPLQAPHEGPTPAPPASNRGGFDRAENRLAAGNQDRGARGREALASIENRSAKDQASKRDVADAQTRHERGSQATEGTEAERAADEKIANALDEKARRQGVAAAEESSETEWGLTSHNI